MHNDLSRELYDLLHDAGKTVATAESCTGGAVAASIVAASGASEYFKGGIVSYCNEVKEALLGVSHSTLEEQTAVSEDVAVQMARGAMKVFGADYAVSVTGTAGPGGGTDNIPVGTIWLCCSGRKGDATLKLTGDNGRKANLENAAASALRMLIDFIRREESLKISKKS